MTSTKKKSMSKRRRSFKQESVQILLDGHSTLSVRERLGIKGVGSVFSRPQGQAVGSFGSCRVGCESPAPNMLIMCSSVPCGGGVAVVEPVEPRSWQPVRPARRRNSLAAPKLAAARAIASNRIGTRSITALRRPRRSVRRALWAAQTTAKRLDLQSTLRPRGQARKAPHRKHSDELKKTAPEPFIHSLSEPGSSRHTRTPLVLRYINRLVATSCGDVLRPFASARSDEYRAERECRQYDAGRLWHGNAGYGEVGRSIHASERRNRGSDQVLYAVDKPWCIASPAT